MKAAALLPLPAGTPVFTAPPAWRAIDFISDLHLAENTPGVFDAWALHLASTSADAVFILGDLFEAWIGDDVDKRSFDARCIEVLAEASRHRTVAFMPGNRDFLVGDAMLQSCGVLRLADPTILLAFGSRLLASHGDALCLDDIAYQRFRKVVRHPVVRSAFGVLPRPLRARIGRALRAKSGDRPPTQRAFIDVDDAAVTSWMRAAGAPVLVHGHTHAPASHTVVNAGIRHVLTDWHLEPGTTTRAEVLRWQASGIERLAPAGTASP